MIRSVLLSVNLQPRRLLLTPQKYLVVQSVKINFVKLWPLLVLQGYLEVSNPLHFTFLWCFMIKQFGPGRHFQVAKFSDVLHFSKSWLQTSASILTLHKFHSIILFMYFLLFFFFLHYKGLSSTVIYKDQSQWNCFNAQIKYMNFIYSL